MRTDPNRTGRPIFYALCIGRTIGIGRGDEWIELGQVTK